MKLLVYVDSVYRERNGAINGEIAFTLFAAALASDEVDVTVAGRLDPGPGPAHYPLPLAVRFVALPHYASLARPGTAIISMWRSVRAFWNALDDVEQVWLFGPSVHAILFALVASARRRGVVLGVRQDFPAYVRSRRPEARWMHLVADVLEPIWRALSLRYPVVVVGPELASHYRRARRTLTIAVSLIAEADVEAGERAASRSYEGELTLLSVGRLDQEKNPLLLADVLAALRAADRRWRMVVCGEGSLRSALSARLEELGLSEAVEFRGHVTLRGGLLELYRSSHVFLHVSFTEGFPQVLTEAFASGVPVVATAVGGVEQAAGAAALLVAPGDAAAAAAAVSRIVAEPQLRRELVSAGLERARAQTQAREVSRVTRFIGSPRG